MEGADNPLAGIPRFSTPSPALGDLDGDGDLDLVIGKRYSYSRPINLRFFENRGTSESPSFDGEGEEGPFDGLGYGYYRAPALGDLDGDGDLDLVIGDEYGHLTYGENLGTRIAPDFELRSGAEAPLDGVVLPGYSRPALGDLDGDSDLDLVVGSFPASYSGGRIHVFENHGTSATPAFIELGPDSNPFDGLTIDRGSAPALGDLDGDGDLDLILGSFYGAFRVFENLGSLASPAYVELEGQESPLAGSTIYGWTIPALGDLDGDGDLDLAVGTAYHAMAYFRGSSVLEVTGTVPGPGAVLHERPTEFVLNFTTPLDPTTVAASDLTVDGIPADSVELVDGDTIRFRYETSPVSIEGEHRLVLAARSLADLDGFQVAAFRSTFFYDAIALTVATTSPESASIEPMPFGRLVVHFNEAIDASSVDASDLGLERGQVSGSRVLGAASVEYLIEGVASDGPLLATIAAGSVHDLLGFGNVAFEARFEFDFAQSQPLPAVLAPAGLGAAMVAEGIQLGYIGADDEDGFRIVVGAGQTLTILLESDSTLRGRLSIERGGAVLASDRAAGPGRGASIRTFRVAGPLVGEPAPGEYTVVVSGADRTTGGYRLRVIVNADVDREVVGGPANDTTAEAQDLAPSYLVLQGTSASAVGPMPRRGAVEGTLERRIAREGFESGALGGAWQTYSSAPNGAVGPGTLPDRDAAEGTGALTMTLADYGEPSLVEATWEVDLSSVSGRLALSFSHMNQHTFGSTPFAGPFTGHVNADGVAVSNDGVHWYPVFTLPQQQFGEWARYEIDLTTSAAIAGLTLDRGRVFVRFQNYVFNPLPRYGRAWDAIALDELDVDVYRLELQAGQSLTVAATGLGETGSFEILDASDRVLARSIDTTGTPVLDFNGSAVGDHGGVRITAGDVGQQAGSVFTVDRLDVEGFTTRFHFQVQSTSWEPAEGFAFVFQSIGSDFLGDPGRQLGYGRAGGTPALGSAAIKFDFVNNEGEGSSSTGLFLDGATPALPSIDLNQSGINIGSGRTFRVAIGYSAGMLTVSIEDSVTGASATQTYQVDLASVLGSSRAHIGFTGSTGETRAIQRVFDWQIGERDRPLDAISDFLAPVAGRYHIRVAGVPGTSYSLTAAIGADLDLGGNDGIAGAEGLGGSRALSQQWILSDVGPTGRDVYRFEAEGGTTLDLATATPGLVGIGGPDPILRLLDGSGNQLAMDDDGARDGRNARIRYRVPPRAGGTYFVEVASSPDATNASRGAVLLTIKGSEPERPPLTATILGPVPSPAYTPPSSFRVEFRDAVLLPTLQASDLSIDGAAIGRMTVVDGNTAVFDAPYAYHWPVERGGDGHYYLPTSKALSWAEAEAEAIALGGHLASIGSGEEERFLRQVLASGPLRWTTYWIGLNDIAEEGTFVWSSGEPVAYSNWGPGEPNGGTHENGALWNWGFGSGWDRAWNDGHVNDRYVGLIELAELPGGWWAATEGTHTLPIASGSILDVRGRPLVASATSFDLDFSAPRVVTTSIAEGGLAMAGDLTLTIVFSEPIDASWVTLDDISLRGVFAKRDITPSRYGFDDTRTILTLRYASLPEDRYALTLHSDWQGLKDRLGLFLDGEASVTGGPSGDGFEGGDFVLNFGLDAQATVAVAEFEALRPLGSLAYRTARPVDGLLVGAADTDDFVLELDAGQLLSLAVRPTSGLRASLRIYDPSGSQVASLEDPGRLADSSLSSVPIVSGGTYTIRVGAADASYGTYSLSVLVNAAFEDESRGGPGNDGLDSAQSLESAFLAVAEGAERAAVVGHLPAIGAFVSADDFEVGKAGPDWFSILRTFSGFNYNAATDVALSDIPGTGGRYALSTFAVGSTKMSDWVVDLSGQAGPLILSFSYIHFSFDIGPNPFSGPFVGFARADGVAISNDGVNWYPLLSLPYNRQVAEFESVQFDLREEARRWGLSLDDSSFHIRFQTFAPQWDPWSSLPDLTYWDDLYIGAPEARDLYSFELGANEAATVVLAGLAGGTATIELLDASGTVVATGRPRDGDGDPSLQFAAADSGTYFVRVTGDVGVSYNLLVTRNLTLEAGANETPDSSTALEVAPGDTTWVLGILDRTIAIDAFESGRWDAPGYNPGGNYLAGGAPWFLAHNFFVFDIPEFEGEILDAAFLIRNPQFGYASDDPSETYSIFDVSSSIADVLTQYVIMPEVYEDLGSGVVYGSVVMTAAENDRTVRVALNSDGLAAILAARGASFAIGGAVTTMEGTSFEGVFSGSNERDAVRRIALTLRDTDHYRVELQSGQALELALRVPGALVNGVAPLVRLYDASGLLVATGSVGELSLTYASALGGWYVIEVTTVAPLGWGHRGEYALGVTIRESAPAVEGGASPSDGVAPISRASEPEGDRLALVDLTLERLGSSVESRTDLAIEQLGILIPLEPSILETLAQPARRRRAR